MRLSDLTLELTSPGQGPGHEIPSSNLRLAPEAGKPNFHLVPVTLGKGGENFPGLLRMFKVEIPNKVTHVHGGTVGLLRKVFTVPLAPVDLVQQSVEHP